MYDNSFPRFLSHRSGAQVVHSSLTRSEQFYMLLNVRVLCVDSTVERFLHMGMSHIGALSPFILDGIPSFPSGTRGFYTKFINVHTVKGNMASGELVTKVPLVIVWCSRVDVGSGRSWITSGWLGGYSNLSVDVSE